MHPALLILALQLRTVALVPPAAHGDPADADSARAERMGRNEQSSFELARRASLPWESGSGGRCDVHLGRFCWWYDDAAPPLPPESERVARRRAELIHVLDSLGQRYPGSAWLSGMRVHYRVDARQLAAADTAARECAASRWWCAALIGYAAHVRGDAALADSAFSMSIDSMPTELRCEWTDIRTLLPSGPRGAYEDMPCSQRAALERRYWMLARPRLSAAANEWRNEFYARRVQSWLAARSRTPQGLYWGGDADELLLRYGWPVQWGRVRIPGTSFGEEYGVVGHDPSPSFAFGPRAELLDSLVAAGDDGWDLRARDAESRFAPRGVRRMTAVSTQLARFRRGDSTLLVAAFAAEDDSLAAPRSTLAATLDDGTTHVSAADSTRRGAALLMLPRSAMPRLAGVEIADTTRGTLARSRTLFEPAGERTRLALSDLLLYRRTSDVADSLAAILPFAIAGDSVRRDVPLGLFWETYGLAREGETVDVGVSVARIDRSWFRSARQRLGLAEPDAPVLMHWTDARPSAAGVAGHSIAIDLGNQAAGRYRIILTLIPSEGTPVRATREIELVAP